MTTETSNAGGVHTCSYACERPEGIRAQRDELVSRLTAPPPAAARGDVRGLAEVIRQAVQTQFETTRPTFGAPRDRLLTGPNTISMAVHTAVEAFLAAEGVQAGEVEQKLKPCPTCAAPCEYEVKMRGGDYGWSTTDEQRTFYKFNAAALSQRPEARGEVDGWRLVIRYGEYDNEPGVWAEKDGSFVWIAALTGERNG